jgi:hypothetical protein
VRNQFGHYVSNEKHDREELTVDGGRRSRDPTRTAEETTNDGKTQGKTTARPRRLATQKESRNGMAKQQLAGVK